MGWRYHLPIVPAGHRYDIAPGSVPLAAKRPLPAHHTSQPDFRDRLTAETPPRTTPAVAIAERPRTSESLRSLGHAIAGASIIGTVVPTALNLVLDIPFNPRASGLTFVIAVLIAWRYRPTVAAMARWLSSR